MSRLPKIALSGVLSRCVFENGQAEIRLSPFAMSREALPVWSLVFAEPDFDASVVQPYLDNEVELEVFETHAIVHDVWQQTNQVLGGAGLNAVQVDYDVADLDLHVRALEAHIEHLHHDLQAARAKDTQGRAILRELFRRAEIKAAASEQLRERQAAAIEVLKRLQTHFGD